MSLFTAFSLHHLLLRLAAFPQLQLVVLLAHWKQYSALAADNCLMVPFDHPIK
jgi:hypothetical protein